MIRSLLLRLLSLQAVAWGAMARGDDVPSLLIEGYTDRLSYVAGESIRFHIATTAPRYSLEIARLGAKTETMLTRSNLPGAAHPIPENASSNGCDWPASFELKVPPEWR